MNSSAGRCCSFEIEPAWSTLYTESHFKALASTWFTSSFTFLLLCAFVKLPTSCWWTVALWADQQLKVGFLCCGRVGYFVARDTLTLTVWHTFSYSVTHMILQCGGIGDWRKWLKFTLHWQREPQDPGPQDLLHTNLNPGTYGHKISSQKTLSQKNPISTAGAGRKPEVKTRLRSKASISSLFTAIKVLRLWI